MKQLKRSYSLKTKLIRSAFIVVIFCCSLSHYGFAQTSVHVYMEIIGGTQSFSDTTISASQLLNGTMVIEVADTTNIAKIHVKMGSTDGSSDLFSNIFNFDSMSNLPVGLSYKREGKVIYLGIGNYTGLNHFFAEAKLEDLSGTIGSAIKYEQ